MKKYLISGFNTVQDVKLEVGTYTLVAYVKSMHGDVYTFALGDGTDWEEFSIDVIQGQLCKVWLTFTIDKKATKFKPIANNFSEELPVYVADLQLTRGNIPVESGASPFDIDQILNDLHDEIDAIEDFTEGAFLDGLLNREEKTQLRASLDSIGSIVESVKGSYDKLLDNPFIHEDTMTSITTRYYAFIASWISDGDPRGLKPVILWIVNGDNIVDQNERDEKDRALNAFNLALYEYNQAEKEVYNDVGENSIAPIIDENGMWAFWSTELQEFIPSEFSAEGDDGHSPYIDVLTGTWWEWNPEIGKYKDTLIKAEGEDGIDGIDGEDAVAPIIIDGFWAFWNKETGTFITSEFSAIGDDGHSPIIRNGYWYEWNPALSGEDKYQNTGIKAEGEDGKDGDGITSTTIEYAKSSNGDTPPSSESEWDTSLPSPTMGWYLWTRTTTTYKFAETTVSYSVSHWAEDGKDGIDGEPPKILDGYPKTQYAIGDSKTIYPTSGWGEAIIDVTESKPYLWSRQEIKYDSGDTLYTGYLMLTNITPIAYMAGEWDLRVAYTRNDKSYPIVTYKKGTNDRPLYYYPKKEGVIGYEYFVTPPEEPSSGWYKKGDIVWYENTDEDYSVILGLYKANKNTRFNPYSSDWDNVTADYAPNGVEGQKLWEFADGVELIITEAIMANFAKLDSFVFHKGKMFSQEGTLRGVAGSNEYTDEDHEPNFEVDGKSGKVKMKDAEVEGTVVTVHANGSKTIQDGQGFRVLNPSGVMNIRFGIKDGYSVLEYYDNDGKFLYDIGPTGIGKIGNRGYRWEEINLINIGSSMLDVFATGKYKTLHLPTTEVTTYYKYVSGVILGELQDPDNHGKIFRAPQLTALTIPSAVYTYKFFGEYEEVDLVDGTNPTTRIYPPMIHESNPRVNDVNPLYVMDAFAPDQDSQLQMINKIYWHS